MELSVLIEIFAILALIALNGFFAMSEMAVVLSRRARLQALGAADPRAAQALELVKDPSRFLSTVQVGITLIGVLAGALGGITVAKPLGEMIAVVPALAGYSQAIGVAVVVTIVTALSIVFGELVPKRLALANPERIALSNARPMRMVAAVAAPAVGFLTWSSNRVLGLLGERARPEPQVTEDEIRHLVEEGARAGAIERVERDIVYRVFRLGDKLVDDIMTPRTQMVWVDAEASAEENMATVREARHSRFPVLRGDRLEPMGVVRIKDLMPHLGRAGPVDLMAAMQPPLIVPETTTVYRLLELFRTTRPHMALVVDEYGELQGLVTLNDIFEAVIGELPPAGAGEAPAVVRRPDGSLLIDGRLSADTLKETLGVERLPAEDEHDFNTMAGMMIAEFGRIPQAGDFFLWNGYRFEVVDMDGPRVDKVLVVPPAAGAGTAP
jgi:putative hemolysin